MRGASYGPSPSGRGRNERFFFHAGDRSIAAGGSGAAAGRARFVRVIEILVISSSP
jgi:hypothetical protein